MNLLLTLACAFYIDLDLIVCPGGGCCCFGPSGNIHSWRNPTTILCWNGAGCVNRPDTALRTPSVFLEGTVGVLLVFINQQLLSPIAEDTESWASLQTKSSVWTVSRDAAQCLLCTLQHNVSHSAGMFGNVLLRRLYVQPSTGIPVVSVLFDGCLPRRKRTELIFSL